MQIQFSPNWQIRQQQIGDCLNSVGLLMSWLRREENTPPEGNLQTCVEATIINVLNRLDKILGDDSVWALNADHDAHRFGAENAALQNGMIHSELERVTTERNAKLQSLNQLAQILSRNRQEETETPKQPRRQQKKSK